MYHPFWKQVNENILPRIFYATNFVKWIPIKYREILIIIQNSHMMRPGSKRGRNQELTERKMIKIWGGGDKKENETKKRMTMRMMVLEWIHIFFEFVCDLMRFCFKKKTERRCEETHEGKINNMPIIIDLQ